MSDIFYYLLFKVFPRKDSNHPNIHRALGNYGLIVKIERNEQKSFTAGKFSVTFAEN